VAKTLWLLRHAKAVSSAGGSDFERPLSDEGRAQAKRLGERVKDQNITFDIVLSSPAVRARETAEVVLQVAGLQVLITYDDRIYEANSPKLQDVISEIDDAKDMTLVVGHNPAIEELLQFLTRQSKHMGTAALAKIISEETSWRQLTQTTSHLDWLAST